MLFFDSDCGVCRRIASLIRRLDRESRIEFAPIRSARGDRLLGDLDDGVRDGSWHLVLPDGRRLREGGAVPELMALLPVVRLFAPLVRWIPEAARDRAYRMIAARRHLLSRLMGARRCSVPPPQ